MKKLTILALYLGVGATAVGDVSVRVCLADGNTPLELADPNIAFVYRDIMVGTKLTIIVSSDANGYWSGDLAIEGEDMNYGLLSARDFNETTDDWAGSRLPAAGDMARMWEWEEPGVHGFSLQGHSSAKAGDWFIIDYSATSIGICNVGFYDHSVSRLEPAYYLTFWHVHSRDFNNDNQVDFVDLAVFASHWLETMCGEPDWCEGADLNRDIWIDLNDFVLFANYWLEKTE